jgi:hypothetical protein
MASQPPGNQAQIAGQLRQLEQMIETLPESAAKANLRMQASRLHQALVEGEVLPATVNLAPEA